VLSGTGRAAQIGRPVAGKTGTTTSYKDGWFIGFSSGLTAGVWMGRDDARPVAGLQGGTAPARAFHDFMSVAVANRPVENFETEVPVPDWQLSPEEEMFGQIGEPIEGFDPMVDPNGMPIYPPGQAIPPGAAPGMRPDGTGDPSQQELDQAFPPQPANRYPPRQPPPPPRQPPPLQPAPADPSQPRP
jgi:penicillin-binding protein 1A